MEIEFDVKITPNALYDYMLHHTYGKLSGLMGSMVGVLMILLFFSSRQVVALIVGIVLELLVLAVLIKKCGKVNLE